MIHPNLLSKLTVNDAKVVQKIVLNTSSEPLLREWILDKDKINLMLDDPKVHEYLIQKKAKKEISATLYYYIITRHIFLKHYIENSILAEYVSAIIEEFSIGTRAFKIARYDDDQYMYLADISKDIQTYKGDRAFLLATHLGNYALWLSGLFPEHIHTKTMSMSYYDVMGCRGFRMASVHPCAERYGLTSVFENLIDNYSDIRIALNDLSTVVNFSR
jgi:hypothetical protein